MWLTNKSFNNSFWVTVDHAIRSIADLAVLAIIARFVAVEVFGQYQLAYSVFMVGSLFGLSGFNGSLLRALARGKDGTLDEVTRLSWIWSLFGTIVLLIAGYSMTYTGYREVGQALVLVSPLFPLFHVLRRWSIVLHAKEMFYRRVKYDVVLSISVVATIWLLAAVFKARLEVMFLSFVVVSVFWQLVFYRKVKKILKKGEVEYNWKKSGFKLVLSEVFTVFYSHLDKVALAFFLGPRSLAIYAVAIVFGEGGKLALGNLVLAHVPRIYRSDSTSLMAGLRKAVFPVLAILVLVIALGWVVMPMLMETFFSDKYSESVNYARYYLLIIPFHLIASIFSYLLIKESREMVLLYSFIIAGVVNVLCYVVFIPWLGISGAVIGSIAYYATLMLATAWSVLRAERSFSSVRS